MLSVLVMIATRFELLTELKKGETVKQSLLFEPVEQLAPFILPVLKDVDKDSILDRVDRRGTRPEMLFEILSANSLNSRQLFSFHILKQCHPL